MDFHKRDKYAVRKSDSNSAIKPGEGISGDHKMSEKNMLRIVRSKLYLLRKLPYSRMRNILNKGNGSDV